MAKPIIDPSVPTACERLHEVAAILAEGYLRLLQMRESSHKELGQLGKKEGREMSHKQLDSFGHQRDEWEMG